MLALVRVLVLALALARVPLAIVERARPWLRRKGWCCAEGGWGFQGTDRRRGLRETRVVIGERQSKDRGRGRVREQGRDRP